MVRPAAAAPARGDGRARVDADASPSPRTTATSSTRRSASQPTTGLVLYPGGKVPSAAYAPQARAIAELGYLVVVVSVPFNLAVFEIDSAGPVIGGASGDRRTGRWAGIRSVGRWRRSSSTRTRDEVDGLVLWASYSAADLSSDGLAVAVGLRHARRRRPNYTSPSATSPSSVPDVTFAVDRRRQPRADGLVHRPAERSAGDDHREPTSRPRSSRRPSTLLDAVGGSRTDVRRSAEVARSETAAGRRADRATGIVAAAIPPMTKRDAERAAPATASRRAGTMARPIDMTGWAQQDDRGDDRRQSRQRDRDQQVAGRLRRDPEHRQPEQARRRRRQVEVAADLADDERARRHEDASRSPPGPPAGAGRGRPSG